MAPPAVTHITTVQEFVSQVLSASDKSFSIDADIDLSGIDLSTEIGNLINCTIEGNGHVISNAEGYESMGGMINPNKRAVFWDEVTGCTIRNLVFKNCTYYANYDASADKSPLTISIIAGVASSSIFNNLVFDTCKANFTNYAEDTTPSGDKGNAAIISASSSSSDLSGSNLEFIDCVVTYASTVTKGNPFMTFGYMSTDDPFSRLVTTNCKVCTWTINNPVADPVLYRKGTKFKYLVNTPQGENPFLWYQEEGYYPIPFSNDVASASSWRKQLTNTFTVNTAEEFVNKILKNTDTSVKATLGADIDLSEYTQNYAGYVAPRMLDGAGHTISGYKVSIIEDDVTPAGYSTKSLFFDDVFISEIKNVCFRDCSINIDVSAQQTTAINMGMLAGTVDQGLTLTNVVFDTCNATISQSRTPENFRCGLIAGEFNSLSTFTMTTCSFPTCTVSTGHPNGYGFLLAKAYDSIPVTMTYTFTNLICYSDDSINGHTVDSVAYLLDSMQLPVTAVNVNYNSAPSFSVEPFVINPNYYAKPSTILYEKRLESAPPLSDWEVDGIVQEWILQNKVVSTSGKSLVDIGYKYITLEELKATRYKTQQWDKIDNSSTQKIPPIAGAFGTLTIEFMDISSPYGVYSSYTRNGSTNNCSLQLYMQISTGICSVDLKTPCNSLSIVGDYANYQSSLNTNTTTETTATPTISFDNSTNLPNMIQTTFCELSINNTTAPTKVTQLVMSVNTPTYTFVPQSGMNLSMLSYYYSPRLRELTTPFPANIDIMMCTGLYKITASSVPSTYVNYRIMGTSIYTLPVTSSGGVAIPSNQSDIIDVGENILPTSELQKVANSNPGYIVDVDSQMLRNVSLNNPAFVNASGGKYTLTSGMISETFIDRQWQTDNPFSSAILSNIKMTVVPDSSSTGKVDTSDPYNVVFDPPTVDQYYYDVLVSVKSLAYTTLNGDVVFNAGYDSITYVPINLTVRVGKAIQILRGNYASWENNSNMVMYRGQPAIIRDIFRFYVGDGTTPWKSLPYISNDDNWYMTRSGQDSNGIYTVVLYHNQFGMLCAKSELSGGTSPQYTTLTFSFYDQTAVVDTLVYKAIYTLGYDENGNLISETYTSEEVAM